MATLSAPPTVVAISNSVYHGQTVETPPGIPDAIVAVVSPVVAILVRAAKAYLQTLLGLLSAAGLGMASATLPAGDFWHTLTICAGLSIGSGVMSLLTNTTLLLTALGDRFPTLKS